MTKATQRGGRLEPIPNCNITVPGLRNPIALYVLPDITDSKKATYNDERVIGRSTPIKTYSHSDNRTISMRITLQVTRTRDIQTNLDTLRTLESLTYPRSGISGGAPYRPPPICQLTCGKLLGDNSLCVVLDTYSVQFPTNVVWDADTLLPYNFSVSLTWHVVYSSDNLPNQDKILKEGS